MTELNLNWKKAGILSEFYKETIDDGWVVYLHIFSGYPKRIIYVGTSEEPETRWKYQQMQLLTGLGTVFRVEESKDIYELMSYKNKSNKKPEDYYRDLALKEPPLLWVPTDTHSPSNFLNDNDSFKDNWESYINKFYIKNIEIWYSKVQNKEEAYIAETLIQSKVSNDSLIGYYETRQSWLGKPSININAIHSCRVESQCNCPPDKLTPDLIQQLFVEGC